MNAGGRREKEPALLIFCCIYVTDEDERGISEMRSKCLSFELWDC